jgi:phosphopantothenoylcysteine decarboxylase/phosphopantothenate--cysteine ligase
MSALEGKNVILGITGGIAAYKSAFLTRLLVKEGADVKVIMTPNAKEFITPLTLATLSKNVVYSEFFNAENGDWNSHVDLGLWADLMIIAPATASTMGKMVNGIADNLLVTSYLSARCPVFIAPAMDLDMYKHQSTQKNIDVLKSYGNNIIEPPIGELASGLDGKGRMEEPENIVNYINTFFSSQKEYKGKKVLITAGPTYEKIDPVRFIGNYSSGKMGYAIAEEIAKKGADVTLVSGPTNLNVKNNNIKLISIESAEDMYKASVKYFKNTDIAIMVAAVADFTPINKAQNKIKREKDNLKIELQPTKDIAAELGKLKNKNQIIVGFALETQDETNNAASKLKRKNLDFIVLNSLNDKGSGFKTDTNKITIIDKNNKIIDITIEKKWDKRKCIISSQ